MNIELPQNIRQALDQITQRVNDLNAGSEAAEAQYQTAASEYEAAQAAQDAAFADYEAIKQELQEAENDLEQAYDSGDTDELLSLTAVLDQMKAIKDSTEQNLQSAISSRNNAASAKLDAERRRAAAKSNALKAGIALALATDYAKAVAALGTDASQTLRDASQSALANAKEMVGLGEKRRGKKSRGTKRDPGDSPLGLGEKPGTDVGVDGPDDTGGGNDGPAIGDRP